MTFLIYVANELRAILMSTDRQKLTTILHTSILGIGFLLSAMFCVKSLNSRFIYPLKHADDDCGNA